VQHACFILRHDVYSKVVFLVCLCLFYTKKLDRVGRKTTMLNHEMVRLGAKNKPRHSLVVCRMLLCVTYNVWQSALLLETEHYLRIHYFQLELNLVRYVVTM